MDRICSNKSKRVDTSAQLCGDVVRRAVAVDSQKPGVRLVPFQDRHPARGAHCVPCQPPAAEDDEPHCAVVPVQ